LGGLFECDDQRDDGGEKNQNGREFFQHVGIRSP
jgi:hypothetical protein